MSLKKISKDAIITIDSNYFNIINVNDVACDLYQYTKKEFLKLNIVDISNEPENTLRSIKNCIKHQEIIAIPLRQHKKKDGTIFPVTIHNGIFSNKSITILIKDLSQFFDEKISKEVEDQLHYLLNNIEAIIFFKDLNNRFIWANKFLLDSYGKSFNDVVGKSVEEVIGKNSENIEMSKGYFENDKEVIKTKKAKRNIIEQYKTKEGIKWAKTDKVPFINSYGDVTGIFGFSVDITELRNTYLQLKEIVDSIPDLIFIIDKNYKFIKNISGDKKDLFMKEEEFIGKTIYEVMPQDVAEITADAFEKVNKNPENPIKFKYKLTINNEEKTFEANLRRLNSNKFIVVIRDITERIKFQILEDFKESVERLIESNRYLKEKEKEENE